MTLSRRSVIAWGVAMALAPFVRAETLPPRKKPVPKPPRRPMYGLNPYDLRRHSLTREDQPRQQEQNRALSELLDSLGPRRRSRALT